MAACDGGSTQSGLPHNGHDYVRSPGTTQTLGTAPAAFETVAGADPGLYRICAVAIRAYGGSCVLERSRTQGTNVPRSCVDARGRAARAVSIDYEHPGVVGEDGQRGRQDLSASGRKRYGWDAHE